MTLATVNALPAPRSSGRLQSAGGEELSPALRYGDASQSASGEELSPSFHFGEPSQSALMPSILDKAFKGEL